MEQLIDKSRAEPGCLGYSLHQEMAWYNQFSTEDVQVFMLSEVWASGNDVERHSHAEPFLFAS